MLQTTHKGLSGTALKTIALVLMLMDHIHYFFEFTGCIPEWFSMLARLSAPLFLFCTVEGFAHTHDRKRYFFRIWCIGAGMAAVQFFMIYAKAFRRGADAGLQRHARQRAQTAVLLVLPGPCLPAVWGVLPGVSPDCIKRRKMLWRIFLRLMMIQIFAHC